MKKVILIVSVVFFASCNNQNNKDYVTLRSMDSEKMQQEHPGKKLMETNCFVCHSPSASHNNRLAPPMIAVKKHYISEDTTKEEFIEAIQNWIKDPKIEDARMNGAVRRFGIMTKTPFPEETIEQIADYMFDNTIEQPEWFEDHFKNRKNKSN